MINKMCFDGKYVTVEQDIANQMNMHFCEIGEKLQDAIPNLGYDYKRYLPIRVENTFFLSPTNIDEILNEIKKLNPKKSVSPLCTSIANCVSLFQASPAQPWVA